MIQLAISAAVAVTTPAIAAGLMAGVSAAASADTQTAENTINPMDEAVQPDANSDSSPSIATHGPKKLSVLAGNDKAAWDSAHSVHVDFRRHPH